MATTTRDSRGPFSQGQAQPHGSSSSPSPFSSTAPTPTATPTPSNSQIEAVILAATSGCTITGQPLLDTRTQLFIGNLPYRVRWQDLKDLFRTHLPLPPPSENAGVTNPILRADVSLGPDNRSRGYGTVLLANREDALVAVERLDGFCWQGRVLEVRIDRLPSPDGPQSLSQAALYERERERERSVGKCLFVGNLPFTLQWQDLKDLFRTAGTIVRADIALEPLSGRSRGWGSVTFASGVDVERAVAMFDGFEIGGRRIVVRGDVPEWVMGGSGTMGMGGAPVMGRNMNRSTSPNPNMMGLGAGLGNGIGMSMGMGMGMGLEGGTLDQRQRNMHTTPPMMPMPVPITRSPFDAARSISPLSVPASPRSTSALNAGAVWDAIPFSSPLKPRSKSGKGSPNSSDSARTTTGSAPNPGAGIGMKKSSPPALSLAMSTHHPSHIIIPPLLPQARSRPPSTPPVHPHTGFDLGLPPLTPSMPQFNFVPPTTATPTYHPSFLSPGPIPGSAGRGLMFGLTPGPAHAAGWAMMTPVQTQQGEGYFPPMPGPGVEREIMRNVVRRGSSDGSTVAGSGGSGSDLGIGDMKTSSATTSVAGDVDDEIDDPFARVMSLEGMSLGDGKTKREELFRASSDPSKHQSQQRPRSTSPPPSPSALSSFPTSISASSNSSSGTTQTPTKNPKAHPTFRSSEFASIVGSGFDGTGAGVPSGLTPGGRRASWTPGVERGPIF